MMPWAMCWRSTRPSPGELTRQGGIRSTVIAYDANTRLVAETIQTRASATATPVDQSSTAYTYDAANNRATKTVTRIAAAASSAEAGENEVGHWAYTYNSANQLTAWEKWDESNGSLQKSATLSYDDAGNRTGQTVDHISTSASDEVTSYTWDAQDRLLGVTMPDGSQHAYEYDYRTRRIGTSSTTPGATPTTKQTGIVFSGGLSVAECESETGSLPVPPTVEYTRGPDMGGGVGGLLYSLRGESGTAAPKYNLSNGRGDIVAQSNHSAVLTWTASYEADGKRTKETGTNQDKQRGNSKDEDPTGLLNEGVRYRDLETGVWLSRDPAGFVDGPNVYAYVKQNSWTAFDPDGLATTFMDDGAGNWSAIASAAASVASALKITSAHAPAVAGTSAAAASTTAVAPMAIHAAAVNDGRARAMTYVNGALNLGFITPEKHAELTKSVSNINAPKMGMYGGGAAQTRDAVFSQGHTMTIEAVKAQAITDSQREQQKKTDAYLYAYGNASGPRPPRDRDVPINANGNIPAQSPPEPDGASTFANPKFAPVSVKAWKIPQATPMPEGTAVVPDGVDVGGKQPATHHTIFPTVEMPKATLDEKFKSLPWVRSPEHDK